MPVALPMASGQSAAAPTPGQPPAGNPAAAQATGPSPATQPVANRGTEQMALVAIGMHAQAIQKLVANLSFGSDAARDINDALNKIRKHAKGDAASPGVEKSQLDAMQMNARQNALRMQQMRQSAAQTQGGGATGAAA